MAQWYYSQGGQQLGPVEQQDLQRMIGAGQLQPGDLVWREGMANWQPASSVAELTAPSGFAAAQYAPPPPQAAPVNYYTAPGAAGAYAGAPIDYYTPPPGQFPFAGFWTRFVAAFVDGLIVGVPFFIVGLLIDFAFDEPPNRHTPPHVVASLGVSLTQMVVTWLYSALLESSPRMATLGKRMMGITVTDLNGQRISFGRATGRHFGKIVSGCILLIGYIMAAFTEKKQALHDIMASTLVLRAQ